MFNWRFTTFDFILYSELQQLYYYAWIDKTLKFFYTKQLNRSFKIEVKPKMGVYIFVGN